MINLSILKKNSGLTLIELLIVITIIGILSLVGIPQYGQFAAKSKVRRAATDLQQNMRLARTMAIKENRAYLITFNEPLDENGDGKNDLNYRIGFDNNGNNSLLDAGDGYGTGAVRTISMSNEYGDNVVLGSANFTTDPLNGPNGVVIADAVSFQFNPDGSANPNGMVYFQHNAAERGYAYSVELVNATGKIDLYMWDGDASDMNKDNTHWSPVRGGKEEI